MPNLVERLTIRCPTEALAEVLTHRPEGWLRPFLRIAGHEGESLGAKLGVPGAAPKIVARRKAVAVSVGDPAEVPEADGEETEIPLRWECSGYRLVFPLLEGRFLLRRLSDDFTELALEGLYEAPGWVIGDLNGRMFADRVARTCVHNLLANLRAAVEEAVRSEPEQAPSYAPVPAGAPGPSSL